uniref:APC membrane recruitment protein 1 n=1 Tax=Paramormyrops kingsleyae TaxID=1676925 RepID=A0A3B3SRQ4_9TELE|nr:APC membrane recruitment protein 1 [Paramormyrops kingsleyae]XP_023690000.1 APC membrane recruitment protein 1 [Paramormyrops kingsleyae]XP_023690001.1 APC membrane recruitment protein 1 [Paramormyrops kingsleyae]XP_023690002.1 APC membrane recruitment protein 1 [Paramormyrops kingsleyae]
MEPSRGNELTRETKPLSDVCEQTARGSEGLQPEAETPSERAGAAPSELQPSGKLKKTAFKLFGGRRSICALPSFFGGRNKSHSKGSSKKGIIKSKTHDCISKVSWEDAKREGDVPAGDFEYHNQNGSTEKTLPSSHSANVMSGNDGVEITKGESYLENGDRKPSLEKSLSFPRPKKGFKGLFSSIRRHKKNKHVKMEKTDLDIPKDVVHVKHSIDRHDIEPLGNLEELNVPASVNVKEELFIAHECEKEGMITEKDVSKSDRESLKSLKTQIFRDGDNGGIEHAEVMNTTVEHHCANSITHLSDINSNCTENIQPSVHSSEQISLIFGDVSSLKSFDSLTGCGDIIADQDDDSVAESSVSGERARNAGKRSSCYVTYQGGGEEMATPDEVDRKYLQGLWESEAAADTDYAPRQQSDFMEPDKNPEITSEASDILSPHIDDDSGTTFSHVSDTAITPGDVLTPQSEHQESVPNSDEGYYDSTTPGADDDGVDEVGRIGGDRLPRDSYSGDALYELFEPDDSLMSPTLKEGSSFEIQKSTPDRLEFLDITLNCIDTNLHTSFAPNIGLAGSENTRLAKIQHELLNSKLQSIQKPLPEHTVLGRGRFFPSDKPTECMLDRQHYSCLKEEQSTLHISNSMEKSLRQGSQSLKNTTKIEVYDKSLSLLETDTICTHGLHTPNQIQASELYIDKGTRRPSPTEKNESIPSTKMNAEAEHDQTICFSQALVDFTKHTQLFNDLSGNLTSSESTSPFAQNMQVLPSMVTFDIVDMENEGEYDDQVEMAADEDVASPFEDYNESYLQKDFVECEARQFDFNEQSLFLNNRWGVASLPRHLSLTKVNQSVSAPLTLNRRSRSLDTDSLEFEMSDMYLVQSRVSLSLNPFSRNEMNFKKAFSLHDKRDGNSASCELKNNDDNVTTSWQPETAGTFMGPLTDGEGAEQVQTATLAQQEKPKLTCGPNDRLEVQPAGHSQNRKTQTPVSNPLLLDKGLCSPVLYSAEKSTWPFYKPLQSEDNTSVSANVRVCCREFLSEC